MSGLIISLHLYSLSCNYSSNPVTLVWNHKLFCTLPWEKKNKIIIRRKSTGKHCSLNGKRRERDQVGITDTQHANAKELFNKVQWFRPYRRTDRWTTPFSTTQVLSAPGEARRHCVSLQPSGLATLWSSTSRASAEICLHKDTVASQMWNLVTNSGFVGCF